MTVIVDTGILYALADADDRWHAAAVAWVQDATDLLIAPVTVLPEVAYLLQTRLGAAAELAFVQSVAAGEIEVEDLRRQDVTRSAEILRRLPELGFVDATIVAIAERLKVSSIATTDRRHFTAVRPKHLKAFTLLPLVKSLIPHR
jgi:predicted nucleic acid-binding protein